MLGAAKFFYWIATVESIALVLLSVEVALVYFLPRPIERLRTIQATMAALVVACLLQSAHVLPQVSLGLLSVEESAAADAQVSAATNSSSAPQLASEPTSSRASDATSLAKRPSHAPGQTGPFSMDQSKASSDGAEGSATKEVDVAEVLEAEAPRAKTRSWQSVQTAVVAIFLFGAAWSLAHLLPGVLRLRRIIRRSRPAPAPLAQLLTQIMNGEKRKLTLRISSEIRVPVAIGVRRGVILLPESILRASNDEALRYCLAHEWSHVRNHDVAQWWAVQLCQSLLWCQPLFWMLRRELRVCQDQIADDFAARQTADPLSYAQLLIELARQARGARLAMALTMTDGQSSLARRIRLLTDGSYRWTSVGRPRVQIAAALVLVAATFGAALVDLSTAHAAKDDKLATITDSNGTGAASTDKSKKDEANKDQPEKNATEKEAAEKEAPPEVPKELNYFGVVIDKTTKEPIEGVRITVRRSVHSDDRILEESKHTTNDRGVFRFVIPPEQVAEPMLYIELDVEHSDYAPKKGFGYSLGMIRKNLKNGEPPFFTRTELDPAEPLTGRVVDPAGKPLAGVELLTYSVGAPSSPNLFEYGSFEHGKTAEDGSFRMNLVKGGTSMLWISPEKFALRQLLIGDKKGDLGDVQVAAGVTSEGQVVDAEGKPVAGVWVNLEDIAAHNEIKLPVSGAMYRSAKTDAEGRFQLGPVKPGSEYKLTVESTPSEMRFHHSKKQKVELPAVFMPRTVAIAEPALPLRIQASPHVLFAAQNRDSKGKNCRGHWVLVYGRLDGENFLAQMESDDEGRIQGKLPRGLKQAQIDLTTNEHSSLRYRIGKDKPLMRDTQGPASIGPLDHDLLDFEIIRYVAPIVTLKVVDQDGARVADAKVAGLYTDSDDSSRVSPAGGLRTDVFFKPPLDGLHRSVNLLPDEKIKFIAHADGYADAAEEMTLSEGEIKEVTLVLKRNAKPDDATKPDERSAAAEAKPTN